MHTVTVFISAGGRGTRLNEIFSPHPELGVTKALLRLGATNQTLVEHHIERLTLVRPANIVVGTGDHPHVIEYVKRMYPDSAYITAVGTTAQQGNGGELLCAVREHPDKFAAETVVVNVDTLLTLPLQRLVETHRVCGGDLTFALTALPGVPNENAFCVGPDGLILHNAELVENVLTLERARARASYRASSTGAMVLRTEFLKQVAWCPSDGQLSLYREIVGLAVRSQKAYAYLNGLNPFLDVGTVKTWQRITEDPTLIDYYMDYGEKRLD